MANLFFKSMFGGFPKTGKIEGEKSKLMNELDEFKTISESEDLAKYLELDQYINSQEFIAGKKEIEAQKFEGTEEHKKEQEYVALKKSKQIKKYYKLKASQELAVFKETEVSQELSDFEALQEFVLSDEFGNIKAEIEAQKFEGTEEDAKEQEYLSLKKSENIKNYYKVHGSTKLQEDKESDLYKKYETIQTSGEIQTYEDLEATVNSQEFNDFKTHMNDKKKFKKTEEFAKWTEYNTQKKNSKLTSYYKFKKSKKYLAFAELDGSDKISNYESLEEMVNSQEFNEFKTHMNDKKKFEKTEDFAKQQEYEALKKDGNIVTYLKLKDSNKFDDLNSWNETFSDDFDSTALDTNKWLTGYYWGRKLMKENYVLKGDKHFFTEGQNIEIDNSTLKLITRKEDVKGKVWDPLVGFVPKDFEYTSGMICTGENFKQKFGKFEAKIKLNHAHPVYHAFWMLSDKMLPEVDILKSTSKKNKTLFAGNKWGDINTGGKVNNSESKISGINFNKDFLIYTLEWTAEKLVWKINNVIVKEQTQGVPQEPMYLLLSAGLTEDAVANLPTAMEIDWVRCYEKVG